MKALAKRQTRTLWDFWAPRYDRLWVQKHSLGPSRAMVLARIEEATPEAVRFLDLGCGIGQFAFELAEARPRAEVVAVDPTPGMIERARRDFAHERVTYLQGSIDEIPRDSGFDVITCMHAFPYVQDGAACARRMHELLRPAGRVLLINANAHTLWDRFVLWFVERTTTPAHYRSVAATLDLLTAAGFRPGLIRPLSKPWYFPSIHLVEGLA
jgi:ubiquinone/menaquinone biosynthesis C-methylase UbiE